MDPGAVGRRGPGGGGRRAGGPKSCRHPPLGELAVDCCVIFPCTRARLTDACRSLLLPTPFQKLSHITHLIIITVIVPNFLVLGPFERMNFKTHQREKIYPHALRSAHGLCVHVAALSYRGFVLGLCGSRSRGCKRRQYIRATPKSEAYGNPRHDRIASNKKRRNRN